LNGLLAFFALSIVVVPFFIPRLSRDFPLAVVAIFVVGEVMDVLVVGFLLWAWHRARRCRRLNQELLDSSTAD